MEAASRPERIARQLLRRGWLLVASALSLVITAEAASAQEGGCEAVAPGNDLVVSQVLPGIGSVTYITNPHFVCEGDIEIFADSSVAYEAQAYSLLLGAVRFYESGRLMRSDEARYFTDLGRLQAEGNLFIEDDAQGSSIENGDLVYLLQTETRDQEEMTVTTGADGLRPVAHLTPAADTTDPNAEPEPPYRVVGDKIVLRGSEYFTSVGDVQILREDIEAYADSAEYDPEGSGLLLEGSASVVGESYELEGRTIEMGDPGADTSEVRAIRDARLVGDDLLLTSARIVVTLRSGALERLVATPIATSFTEETDSADLVKPEATVGDFQLNADSLEVIAPGEVIERVFASGNARSVSTGRDTLNVALLPEIARTDWLEGDTVIITFKPPVEDSVTAVLIAAGDSSLVEETSDDGGDLVVDEVIARVSARSLYRLPAGDSTSAPGVTPPAVHYVTGDEIRVRMVDGEVEGMHVEGQTRGVHLEPVLRQRPAPDSTVQVDTASVPDTSGVAQDSGPSAPTPDEPHGGDGALKNDHPIRSEDESWIRR